MSEHPPALRASGIPAARIRAAGVGAACRGCACSLPRTPDRLHRSHERGERGPEHDVAGHDARDERRGDCAQLVLGEVAQQTLRHADHGALARRTEREGVLALLGEHDARWAEPTGPPRAPCRSAPTRVRGASPGSRSRPLKRFRTQSSALASCTAESERAEREEKGDRAGDRERIVRASIPSPAWRAPSR